MSLEKAAAALSVALTDYIKEVVNAPDDKKGKAITKVEEKKAPPKQEAIANPKATAELEKKAKLKASKVLKELGKEKLVELLDQFCCKNFKSLDKTVDSLTGFIGSADLMLKAPVNEAEDDDLLGACPAETVVHTIDDVKGLLLKINNTEGLGRDITKQILSTFGVARLADLKAKQYEPAYRAAEKALNSNV